MEENFLTQLVSEPTRGGALLDLLLVNREELVGEVKVGGHLGCSDHEMIKFSILRETKRGVSKTATLDFWRANFDLFKRLINKIPWEAALKDMGVQEERSLKGTGAGCPRVSKNKQVGKGTGVAKQGPLAGSQEQKENLLPLEEGPGLS